MPGFAFDANGGIPLSSPQSSTESQSECQHKELTLRVGSPEYELQLATDELKTGKNLQHGAKHLAELLAYDPANSQWRALLDRYIEAADGELESLLPKDDQLYYAIEALRAYLWQKQGMLTEAIDLLLSVVIASPDTAYLDAWVCDWLEADGVMESLPADLAWQLFATVLNNAPECSSATVSTLKKVKRWSALCQRYATAHSGEIEAYAIMVQAGLLRKAGLLDEAEVFVRKALEKDAEWQSATALGLILREKEQCNEAEQAFEQALKIEPGDMSARLEAGDMHLNRENFESALKWYENALSLKATDEWAYPSALFCHWMQNKYKRSLAELIELARNGNQRARQLYYRAFGGLPEPADASARILRQVRQEIVQYPEEAPRGELSLEMSSLEAPSNYLAFDLEMRALKHDLKVKVSVDEIPSPDPRLPLQSCKYEIWKYNEIDASPGLPAPSAYVLKRITELAASRYDEIVNWASASRIAAELGTGSASEILAVLVHPPEPPPSYAVLKWLPRVQLSALQVVAHLGSGWEGSVRKDALLSALFGPRDWITNAAIRVMTYIGETEPVHSEKISDAFSELAASRPRRGYCCWEHTLYTRWLRLPHLFESEREGIENILFQLERG